MTVKKISISVDIDVFHRLEQLRAGRTQFRSEYINTVLRTDLGLEKVEK
jgi:metal-responsive CopG/Arc/MetJ family transcriptional regulator